MSDNAGREAWLSNMQAQKVMRYQGVDQAETCGPAAASAVLQPLPAFDAAAQPLSAVLQPLSAFSPRWRPSAHGLATRLKHSLEMLSNCQSAKIATILERTLFL